jgi:hypothetical protein
MDKIAFQTGVHLFQLKKMNRSQVLAETVIEPE